MGFLEGLARVLDIGARFPNRLPLEDAEAIAGDWEAIIEDLEECS